MGERAASGERYGYWFPLALLGFGLLGLLGWDSVRPPEDIGWFAYAPLSSETGDAVEGEAQLSAYYNTALPPGLVGPLRDWPWTVLITVTLVGAVAWYAWDARRAGRSVRMHVALAVGGAIAVPACYVIAAVAEDITDPVGLIPSVGLPLLVLGGLAGAWAYRLRGAWRATVAAVSVMSLVAGVGTVVGAWSPGLLDAVLITTGVGVLAWYERSRLLVVVACAVLAALVLSPEGTLSMLVPAVIVLAAAIAALARRTSAPA